MGAKRLSVEEKEMICEGIRGGMTNKGIADIIGRSEETIRVYRNKLKNQDSKDSVEIETNVEEAVKKEPEKYVQDVRDDPRWKRNIEIHRIIKISGNKTNFQYIFDENEEDIMIRNDLEQEFHVGLREFTKFIDELDDIEAEIKPRKLA